MDNNIYGKNILIGREEGQNRLLIAVEITGKPYFTPIGTASSVPSSVSRCIPNEGKAHCRLDIDENGKILISNLKIQNTTCVNGCEIIKKYIDETDSVTLGRDEYALNIVSILETASKIITKVKGSQPPQPPEYSIKHLEQVWNEFNERNEEIDKDQLVTNLMMRIPFIFSTLSGIITGVAKTNNMDGIGNFTLILTFIGLAVLIYGFHKSMTSPASKMKKENQNDFKSKYICPNPECKRKLTNFDYEELQKMKKCPYCGCRFK